MKKENKCSSPEMPYERFLSHGRESLSNAELLAVLLRSGIRGEPVLSLAREILSLHDGDGDSLAVLHQLSLEELMKIPGIGKVKAIQIQCLLELSKRLAAEAARGARLVCEDPSQVAACYMESLRHESQERVMLLLLDARHAVIREETLTIGTVNASLCSPRDVFIRALQAGASAVLVMHNHPSGDPSPSSEDIRLTRRLSEVGALLEVPLLDHIIVGDRCYYSMKEAGLQEPLLSAQKGRKAAAGR